MLPTLNARGDVLLTEYMSPRLNLLKAGDVIVATKPNDSKTSVIKRIRGMSGDKIWVRRQGGASLPEEVVVPEGHVWLEGDNPLQSTDSRDYGPVPLGLVRGRIVLRFWPPTQAQMIRSHVIDHTQRNRDAGDGLSSRPAIAAVAPSPSYHALSISSDPAHSAAVPAAQAPADGPCSMEGHASSSVTETSLLARPEN
jgi:mitochondrial inner membrane protease subunit 1